MRYEKLEGTHDIKEVSFSEFVECWFKSNTRGYNTHEPVVYDDYIALSSPLPNRDGVHYTLVYDCKHSNTNNPYEVLYEMFYEFLVYYDEWVRDDERNKIIRSLTLRGKV